MTTTPTLRKATQVSLEQRTQTPLRSHRPWWRTTAESILVLAGATLALEGFFSLCGVGMEEILEPDPKMGSRHIAGKDFVWRMEGFSKGSFNSAGLRDVEHKLAKAPGVFRIALIGDSATEGLQVPFQDTYGVKLQEMLKRRGLNAEVINFACSGYSTGQEILQFEQEISKYSPDLTIMLYNRGDAVENIRKPGDLKVDPRPYFFLDKQGRIQQDNSVLVAQHENLKPNQALDFLRRNSRIYGVFSHANLNLTLNESLYRKIRKSIKGKQVPVTEPVFGTQEGWPVTKQLLERLITDCRKAGTRLVFISFPNVVNDPEFDHQIQEMSALSKKSDCGFYDLTEGFRWNHDPMSLFFKYHFSSKGHDLVAFFIDKYLSENGYLNGKASSDR